MLRLAIVACLLSAFVVGCAAPGPKMGPPPEPVLATRAPRVVAPLPPPERPEPPPPRVAAGSLRGRSIVVDPGHGGEDPGALGRGPMPEKAINLDIARNLATELRDRGANVTLTRSGDRFISLDARAALADRTGADLFISIHADSSKKSSVQGMTIYIGRNASGESRRAAQAVAGALERNGLELRGVNSAGYRVLVGHSRPAMLIECGFVSNRAEAERLASASYRARIAAAIAEGVASHFSR